MPFHIWKADIYDISHGKSLNLNEQSHKLATGHINFEWQSTHYTFTFCIYRTKSKCWINLLFFCWIFHSIVWSLGLILVLFKENREYRGNLLFNVYIISTALNILISLSPIQPQLITITIILILVPRPCHLHDTLP